MSAWMLLVWGRMLAHQPPTRLSSRSRITSLLKPVRNTESLYGSDMLLVKRDVEMLTFWMRNARVKTLHARKIFIYLFSIIIFTKKFNRALRIYRTANTATVRRWKVNWISDSLANASQCYLVQKWPAYLIFLTICVNSNNQYYVRFSDDSSGWKTLFLFFVVVVVVFVEHADTCFPNWLMHLFTEEKFVRKKTLSKILKMWVLLFFFIDFIFLHLSVFFLLGLIDSMQNYLYFFNTHTFTHTVRELICSEFQGV